MEGDIKIEAGIFSSADIKIGVLSLRNLGMLSQFKKGSNIICFEIPRNPFYPDQYSIHLLADKNQDILDDISDAAILTTIAGSFQVPDIISKAYSTAVAFDYSAAINRH